MSVLNLEVMSDKERKPVRYLDMAGVGRWFGVSGVVVATWKRRYEPKLDQEGNVIDPGHPIPEPDVIVGERMWGWAEDREQEWRAWHAARPGQGAGGGPRKKGGPRSGGR